MFVRRREGEPKFTQSICVDSLVYRRQSQLELVLERDRFVNVTVVQILFFLRISGTLQIIDLLGIRACNK